MRISSGTTSTTSHAPAATASAKDACATPAKCGERYVDLTKHAKATVIASIEGRQNVRAVTDAAGIARLVGLDRARSYKLEVEVGAGLQIKLTGWALPVFRGTLDDDFVKELHAIQ